MKTKLHVALRIGRLLGLQVDEPLGSCQVRVRIGGKRMTLAPAADPAAPEWNVQREWEFDSEEKLWELPMRLAVFEDDPDAPIGTATVDLAPLCTYLSPEGAAERRYEGAVSVFDSLRGVVGELEVAVAVALRGRDTAKGAYRSVGFFAASDLAHVAQVIDLVGALSVKDDPEFDFRDRLRSARESNEMRRKLLAKMSGKLRRKLAKETALLGGNAVLGYREEFDLEGEYGIVARGYGTAVSLRTSLPLYTPLICGRSRTPSLSDAHIISSPGSAVSDAGSLGRTPSRKGTHGTFPGLFRAKKLLTVSCIDPAFVERVGGLVACRTVKFVRKGETSSYIREGWWKEVRDNILLRAQDRGCTHVIGYTESVAATEDNDICILSAMGTAVTFTETPHPPPPRTCLSCG